jgi:hypothetical protein
MEKVFEVEVIYKQRALYQVQAVDPATAERIATERWQKGDASDTKGIEWSEMVSAHAVDAPDQIRQAQDDELVLRFIRERERLLLKLGGDAVTASINDSISASQVANDLGWERPADGEGTVSDVVRAAQALERLCLRKKLVCFERTRVRSGERGEIRLYCTPEYLDGLSSSLDSEQRQVGA